MSSPTVEVTNLHRSFGNIHAVQGVSFNIFAGQVVGFIGANGAGKTTTMRIVATLDIPDRGTVRICGHDTIEKTAHVRKNLGWMPDAYGTYEVMNVYEYLDFFARAYGLIGSEREERIRSVMEFTELTSISDRDVDALSKGMGQRLCLGRTLLNDPRILLLDEPAAGLDPKARVEFKHLVRLLAQEGKSILISSHILSELEDMCDTLLFIDAGRIVHLGSAETLKRANQCTVVVDIKVCGESAKLEELLLLQPGVKVLEVIKNRVRIEVTEQSPEAIAALLRRLVLEGIAITDFHEHERRLEEAFIDLLKKTDGADREDQE